MSLVGFGVWALYVLLVINLPRIGATLVFAVFAWGAYHEAVLGNLSDVAYAICCGLVYGGMPIVIDRMLQPTGIERA